VYMSLSDRERRLLAEMEAALATDDPGLESKMAGSTMTATKPRLLLALALVVLGIGVIFAALISKTTPVGVVGFLISLTGVLTLIRSLGAVAKGAPRAKTSRKSLSKRLDERWEQRDL
jgi:F0F1-type ATP synthase assembly protein I